MFFGRRVQVLRVGLGLSFLLLTHLLSDIPLVGLVRQWQISDALGTVDDVTAFEQRFESVQRELPARGAVGYRVQLRKSASGDVFTYRSGRALVDVSAAESLWLTQYTVAPVIVDSRGTHPLTIANLRDEVKLLRGEGR